METKSFIFSDGIVKHNIKYATKDFKAEWGGLFSLQKVPEEAVKLLVMTAATDNNEIVPLLDSHAPEEYLKGAAVHEYFCCCCKDFDEPLEIRDDEHRCADVERFVLEHFTGDKNKFIEQRLLMFKTIVDCGLNGNPKVVARMKEAIRFLESLQN